MSVSRASAGDSGLPVSDEKASTRLSSPSSSRMFDFTCWAMNSATSSGSGTFSR